MNNAKTKTQNPDDPNVRDPEHAHELGGTLGMTIGGVVAGIAGGAAAGATAGGLAGPLGVIAGAAIGGAIGGASGESFARGVNPTAEEEYWEKNHTTRSYIKPGYDFESYRPAYLAGIEGYASNPKVDFDNLEPSLCNNWGIKRGESKLEWNDAKHAARDAFERLKTSN